jgi:hypothetical protein
MLRAELAGEPYSKAAHNRDLRTRLNGRSKQSVEYKHQNISAVLIGMGLPYIDGYKPTRNFQRTVLPQSVGEYLVVRQLSIDGYSKSETPENTQDSARSARQTKIAAPLVRHPEFFDRLADGPVLNPSRVPSLGDRPIEAYFESPPGQIIVPEPEDKPWLSRRGRRIDFARRDAFNHQLGQLGERFAVEIERQRLIAADRDDLAAKVEWVAQTCGDGVGFDVLSFDVSDDSEQFIEVKTTGLGRHFPFYVTANEVRCSEDRPGQFRLYRVFDFGRNPRVYVVAGALSREFRLEPIEYRASI